MDQVKKWYADGTFDAVFPRTCQAIWAAQPPALLAWFKDNEPRTLERTRWILMCKDYVRYRLTGEAYSELTDSSGTNLMNVHDLRYDPDVLGAFGLAEMAGKLPPVRGSAEICGRVTPGGGGGHRASGGNAGCRRAFRHRRVRNCIRARGPGQALPGGRLVEHQPVPQRGARAGIVTSS